MTDHRKPGLVRLGVHDDRFDSHHKRDRDRARVRLRVAQDRFARAEAAWLEAVEERAAAAVEGYTVGLDTPEIAELLGGIPGGHAGRMIRRAMAKGER